ncbi:MAG: single-stranded-DNA-specific exonuclease RecJ [Anaerolineaceae bacterium]
MHIPIEKEWKIAPVVPENIRENLSGYSKVMTQLLYNRGIEDIDSANSYLHGSNVLYDPFLLKDMQKAVDCILDAIDAGQKIAVFGDYDVDGITATALLTQVLEKIGANVIPYIPDRFTEGYGVNLIALNILRSLDVNLIVTVDCGIRSPNELYYATNELGMKVIVSDHHMPEELLPIVDAIICQKQPGDEYPDKNLSGAGLALKIANALLLSRPVSGVDISDYLDLAALGTVADVVPLSGENRAIVRRGLTKLRMTRRVGLLALMQVAKININSVTTSDIGFGIAPRLNAAGRILSNHAESTSETPIVKPESAIEIPAINNMDDISEMENLILEEDILFEENQKPLHQETQKALSILMTNDKNYAGLLAQELDDLNKRRQKMTQEMQKMAETQINLDELCLFARDEQFNSGLVGLVAAKLTEFYYRPTIIGFKGKVNTRASCRSIPEFHITEALDLCKDLLLQHGGHAMAAGFTIENEKWDELIKQIMQIVKEKLDHEKIRPKINVDIEIPLTNLPKDILIDLDKMEPIGADNPPAIFVSRKVQIVRSKPVGQDEKHLKLTLKDGSTIFDGIAFNQGYWSKELPGFIDILYQIERNIFNGNIYTQLNIKDIKAS